MNVKLISYTQGTDGKNLLEQVAYAARVSNPSNQDNNDTAEKLVRYLIKHQHWSPLEMVNVCLEIETTRDIARQILRHRSFSFQEFSQRYAVADLGFEFKEARLQDEKNRQNSIETDDGDLTEWWEERQAMITSIIETTYGLAITKGIAKECARVILPEGLTPSRVYMSGTIRSWLHFLQVRQGNGTQKEHIEIANQIHAVLSKELPLIFGGL